MKFSFCLEITDLRLPGGTGVEKVELKADSTMSRKELVEYANFCMDVLANIQLQLQPKTASDDIAVEDERIAQEKVRQREWGTQCSD